MAKSTILLFERFSDKADSIFRQVHLLDQILGSSRSMGVGSDIRKFGLDLFKNFVDVVFVSKGE